jgi:hypothetical protein
MDQYHGTDKSTALSIIKNGVDITKGGGELGLGFYTGNYEWEAFNWNWHKYSDKGSVIQFKIAEDPFWKLDIQLLSVSDGMSRYKSIKKGDETRSYLFNCDVVWATFFGYTPKCDNAEQMKFESKASQLFLNGSDVTRNIK